MVIAKRVFDDLRFLTLTSSPDSPRPVQKSLQLFVKRVRRSKFGRKFEYCLVRTSEGLGVLHLLFRGSFIPVGWIRKTWWEIHRAYEVWISLVEDRKGGIVGMAGYLVRQYMSGQSLYVRGSASRHWIFVGATRVFHILLKAFGYVSALGDFKGILLLQACLEIAAHG
jgi:hypothetical protein